MRHLVFVLVTTALCAATPLPSGTTTARSPGQFGETMKQLTSQLMETNTTSEVITLDTRTPPKIKLKKKIKPELIENSHAGIAIPVDEEEVVEESTKKMNFYKIEKPTTNSGLSTWILLSGQSTPKPSRRPIVKPNENQNVTLMVDKIVKPIFKKRVSTTTTPPTATTKLTKVKASVLSGAKKVPTTTEITTTISTTTTTNSSRLPVEAKDGETDLSEKKTRRPTTKRKKNKNRRRRPSEKSDNSTKIDKPIKTKEKPIGSQLYSYLSREVMPTVGVGLVGLMVTAGLASYFLYPFGVARRSYEVDRKDKDYFYYTDEYSGGIAEEEAIGKVIAGMPTNSLYGNNFKTPTSRHSFNNLRMESTTHGVPNEEATPAAVPEHGPRRLRRRRQLPEGDSGENEIDGTVSTSDGATFKPVTTTDSTTVHPPDKVKSFMDVLKDLFQLKVHFGLQLLQNATQAVSKYVSHVQRRLDQHYRNYQNTTL